MAVLAAKRVLLPAIRPAPGGPAPLAHLDGCLAAIGTPAAAGWRARIGDLAAARDDFAAGDLPARMMALDRMHALLADAGADRRGSADRCMSVASRSMKTARVVRGLCWVGR
ncbi:hypothetical protein ACFQ4K_24575 [Tistrella bauzanensis]